jgi:hypothetical protein
MREEMDTQVIEGRVCRDCNEFKPFLLLKKNYGGKKGYQRWCLECASTTAQKWKKANPEKLKAQKDTFHYSQLKKTYGITHEDYTEMFCEQEGRCKICRRHQEEFTKRLFVDHCHETGVVRGLLCARYGKRQHNDFEGSH